MCHQLCYKLKVSFSFKCDIECLNRMIVISLTSAGVSNIEQLSNASNGPGIVLLFNADVGLDGQNTELILTK